MAFIVRAVLIDGRRVQSHPSISVRRNVNCWEIAGKGTRMGDVWQRNSVG